MKKIALFHANAGYGHRKVAEIIEKEIRGRGRADVQVALEDALDSTPGYFKASYPAVYFNSVKYTPGAWGWSYETLDLPLGYKCIHPLRTFANRFMGQALLDRVIREAPDVIVCTHFFSAELFSRARREGKLRSKIVVVITDFYPHSFWVAEGTDLYWVMSPEGVEDLKMRGVPENKIKAGGIPVDKAFLPTGQKKALLAGWGLNPETFTLLLTSGSFGLGPTAEILEELKAFSDKIQAVVVCGNNKQLEAQLKARAYPYPARIHGFVNFMPDLMEASDLMIAKSGGSTTCESLVKGLPMVVLKPIPGQETRNAALLKKRNAAFFMEQPAEIKVILESVFKYPHVLTDKRRAIQELARPDAARDLVDYVLNLAAD
ncbi:MAG TPA: glycosyltransferase [Verrucomicrobiae bacterium]|jgi:processive 1,2-diacylglycerol beta-glucosyltransferase|nr:glycosyltransferase [Verrucomicrobiae bacterium]